MQIKVSIEAAAELVAFGNAKRSFIRVDAIADRDRYHKSAVVMRIRGNA